MTYKYSYDGPVMEFNRCVMDHWKGTTYAVSEKKAKSNLTFQYKRQHDLVSSTKVSLPGKLTIEGEIT